MPDDLSPGSSASAPEGTDALERQLDTLLLAVHAASAPPPSPAAARAESPAAADDAKARARARPSLPVAAQPRPPGGSLGLVLLLGTVTLAVVLFGPFLPRISVGPNDVRLSWPMREQPAAMTTRTDAKPSLSYIEAPPLSALERVKPEAVPVVAPAAGDDAAPRSGGAAAPGPAPVAMAPPPAIAPDPPSQPAPIRDPEPTLQAAEPPALAPPPVAAVAADPPMPAAPPPPVAAIAADPPVPAAPPVRAAAAPAAAAASAQFLVQFGAFRNEAVGEKDCADFARLAQTRLVRSAKGEDTWYLCRTDAPRSRDEAKALLAAAAAVGKNALLVPAR